MISIRDIAKRVGMSSSTVSRVVNGKSNVNDETREKILKVIEESGYVPNRAAQNMVMKRSFTIGIVIPAMFNMFQRQLFSVMERGLELFGYRTFFFFVEPNEASEEACIRGMQAENLDGAIILQDIQDARFCEYLRRSRLPVVFSTIECEDFPTVHIDDERAAIDAVAHLVELGHRDIVMISSGGFTFGNMRMKGFLQALRSTGLPAEEDRVLYTESYTAEAGMQGMKELLRRRNGFSAVYAATDELAIGAMRALADAGIRVPEDVSVIGLDDIEISSYMIPRLTTIQQPLDELGERTVSMLQQYIDEDYSDEKRIILPHRLVVRDSTASR